MSTVFSFGDKSKETIAYEKESLLSMSEHHMCFETRFTLGFVRAQLTREMLANFLLF